MELLYLLRFKEISLKISPGEIVGLLGPNGAGKTTSFNLLIGQLYPDSGSIFLNEKEVTQMSMPYRARLGIAYLPQEPSVFRNLSVKQNLDIALSQSFSNPARLRLRREQLINEFNLSSFFAWNNVTKPGYMLIFFTKFKVFLII